MSEKIYKVLSNVPQTFSDAEKLQARTNIGAIGGVKVFDGSTTTTLEPDADGNVTVDLSNAGKVQSDWAETNSAEPSYILNKPDLSQYVLKSEIEDLKGVFIGVYTGVEETTTPYADYKSAWEAGKAVFLTYSTEDGELLLPMEDINDDRIIFTRTVGTVSNNSYGHVVNSYVQVSNEDEYTFYSADLGEDQVQSDWAQTNASAVDFIKNKPNLATVATSGSYNDLSDKPTIVSPVQSNWTENDNTSLAYIQNKPNLATVATSGSYNDLSDKPSIPSAQVQSDWSQTNSSAVDFIKNKPNLAQVATSGSYNDLSDKPSIPASPVQSNWTESDTSSLAYILNKPNLSTVATSGSYNDLSDKPSIPAAQVQSDWAQTNSSAVDYIKNKPAAMETKPLIAGTNIEFVPTTDDVTINCTASKITKRSAPYTTAVDVTSMTIFDPGADYGSVLQDQNANTLGFLAPKHYGQADLGKVLSIVSDNGYKMEWRNPTGGTMDLKPLTIAEQHIVSENPVTLTVVDGYAYEVIIDSNGSPVLNIATNSEETVHSVISVRNGSASLCATLTIVWRDEAMIQHEIELNMYEADTSIVYNFDVYVKKVVVNNTTYAITRIHDFPVLFRKAPYQFDTEYEGVGYVGLEMN